MIRKVEIERFSVTSSKPFESILQKLEAQIGHPDMSTFAKAVAAAESYGELEKIVQEAIGTSGLMEFTRFNLGEIIRKERGPDSGGRQIAITSTKDRRVSFGPIDFYHNVSHLIGVDTMKLTGTEIAKLMNQLHDGFQEGLLQAPAITTWPLERAVEAYEAVDKGLPPTKHILIPGTAR